jgi:hypothetical protein
MRSDEEEEEVPERSIVEEARFPEGVKADAHLEVAARTAMVLEKNFILDSNVFY